MLEMTNEDTFMNPSEGLFEVKKLMLFHTRHTERGEERKAVIPFRVSQHGCFGQRYPDNRGCTVTACSCLDLTHY